jgi:hypothetical protein
MRIRFNISPISDVEKAMISLINGYPDGLRSELVRRLVATGYHLHSNEDDLLNGINIHTAEDRAGITCKFNVSASTPENDPALKAFKTAKGLNNLFKPLYLNKLIRSGYLFEMGMFERTSVKASLTAVPITQIGSDEVIKEVNNSDVSESAKPVSNEISATRDSASKPISLLTNPGLKASLKNLSN